MALLALAVPAPAAVESAGGFKYVSKEGRVKAEKSKTVKAPCPGNTQVWWGGASSSAFFGEASINGIPYDGSDAGSQPDDGWKSTVRSTADRKLTMTARAVCTKRLNPVYKDQRKKAAPNALTSYSVGCGGDRMPVGGGLAGDVALNSTFPISGNAWLTFADNRTAKATPVTAYAVCVEPSLALSVKTFPSPAPASPGHGGGASQPCDPGDVGTGGGNSNSGGSGTIVVTSMIAGPDLGASVLFDNRGASSESYTTYTVCFDPSI